MKKTKKRSSKSGFEQGRSGNRPSPSAIEGKKKKKRIDEDQHTKESKQLKKLTKAKEELVEVLKETRGSGMVGGDLDIDEVSSIFEKEMRTVRKTVSNKATEFNSDAVSKMMLRSMLTMILDTIPIAEKAFRTSKKENAAYALNALINQAREIATDLKMSGDVENQTAFIRDSILDPVYRALAMHFMREMMNLKALVETEVPKAKIQKNIKRGIDQTMRTIGQFMTQSVEKISSDVEQYLSGDMTTASGKIKKKKKER